MAGFKSLPQATVVRKAPVQPLPPTVPAGSIEFDEDGRLLLAAPVQPLPRPTATLGPFGPDPKPAPPAAAPRPAAMVACPLPMVEPTPRPARVESPAADERREPEAAGAALSSHGSARATGRLKPAETATLRADDIAF
jgi:hypothetical protein